MMLSLVISLYNWNKTSLVLCIWSICLLLLWQNYKVQCEELISVLNPQFDIIAYDLMLWLFKDEAKEKTVEERRQADNNTRGWSRQGEVFSHKYHWFQINKAMCFVTIYICIYVIHMDPQKCYCLCYNVNFKV